MCLNFQQTKRKIASQSCSRVEAKEASMIYQPLCRIRTRWRWWWCELSERARRQEEIVNLHASNSVPENQAELAELHGGLLHDAAPYRWRHPILGFTSLYSFPLPQMHTYLPCLTITYLYPAYTLFSRYASIIIYIINQKLNNLD